MSIPGSIPVTGIIAPTDNTDTYPVIDPKYGIDGLRNVSDYTERNNIPIERRREGMVVGVISTGEYWRLKSPPWNMDNSDWELFFNLSSSWNLGGNNVNSVESLGTINNYDLSFITNNIERLRIASTGEVGIGISTGLSARLHVRGVGDTSATVAFRVDSSTSNNLFFVRDDGVVNFIDELWRNNQRFIGVDPNGTSGNLLIGHGSGNGIYSSYGGSNIPDYNIAIGFNSLYSNSEASHNIAIGAYSLYSNYFGEFNIAIGNGSLYSNYDGSYNIAIGRNSLYSNYDGLGNIAIGYISLFSNTTGSDNTAIGNSSLSYNTTGYDNIAVGSAALIVNTTGHNNISIGNISLYSNTTGSYNIAIGNISLHNNTTSSYNTAIGYEAIRYNTTGSDNVAVGYNSMKNNTTGSENTALGAYSLINNTIGNKNTAVGYYSLFSNTTGNENTALGAYSLSSNTIGTHNTAIGHFSGLYAKGSNNVFIGYSTGYNTDNTNNANNSILIGANSKFINSTYTSAIAIGSSAVIRESNVFVLGSDQTIINKAFLGRGQVSENTSSFALSIHGIPGSDINGADPITNQSAQDNIFFIDGSRGTGTGRGGNIIFRTAEAGSSGDEQNRLTEVLKITDTQRVFIKAPTTPPTNDDFIDHGVTNTPQFTAYVDEINNMLYFRVKYTNGAFKSGSVPLL